MAILGLAIRGLILLIFIDAVLSWIVPDARRFPRSLTTRLTEPLYKPVRALLPPNKTGGLDLSPVVLIAILYGLARLLRLPV